MNRWFASILDFMSLCARAAAAERYYEEHKRLSVSGVTRWTLHRAVFDKLTHA
jgi:hypothetical protein